MTERQMLHASSRRARRRIKGSTDWPAIAQSLERWGRKSSWKPLLAMGRTKMWLGVAQTERRTRQILPKQLDWLFSTVTQVVVWKRGRQHVLYTLTLASPLSWFPVDFSQPNQWDIGYVCRQWNGWETGWTARFKGWWWCHEIQLAAS